MIYTANHEPAYFILRWLLRIRMPQTRTSECEGGITCGGGGDLLITDRHGSANPFTGLGPLASWRERLHGAEIRAGKKQGETE